LVAALGITPLAAARPAAAQPTKDATANQHAVELYAEGRNLIEAGRPADALPKLVASLAALPSPNTELLIAHAHRELGHRATALRTYEHVAESAGREVANGVDKYKDALAEARRWKTDLEPQVGAVIIDGTRALTVEVLSPGDPARVPAKGGEKVWVDPGDVLVRTTGAAREEKHVTVARGAVAHVAFGGGASQNDAAARADGADGAPAVASSSGPVISVPGIVVASVGVAAFAVAAGTGAAALSLESDLEERAKTCQRGQPCEQAFEDDKAKGVTLETVTNAMIGVGAGLVAAGATIWIVQAATSDGDPPARAAWVLTPTFDVRGAPTGVGVAGRF
jgi:hypothetical protein